MKKSSFSWSTVPQLNNRNRSKIKMMTNSTMESWEELVKKQLKTDDIYTVLQKENLEGIELKPYYSAEGTKLSAIPGIEESTQLVADYSESLEDDVFAFLLNENVEGLEDKTVFINNLPLAEHLRPEENDRYFSLIDVFDEAKATINNQLAKELLAKDFSRKICIDISKHQNAGAAIYQQLGIALAKTKDLVEEFGAEILNKLIIRIAVGPNYLFEIAKIRALKMLFISFSKEYGLNEIPYVFAETTFRNKTKTDPENNLIRSTLEIAAAMIGGADAVYSNDFRLAEHSELSREISFKQQIVLAYESIINVFADAGNGSYVIEDLTRQFSEKAWKLFLEMEEAGGYLELLKKGVVQQKIYEHAVQEQKWVQEGKIKLVGINLYPKLDAVKNTEEMYSTSEVKPVRWSEMFE